MILVSSFSMRLIRYVSLLCLLQLSQARALLYSNDLPSSLMHLRSKPVISPAGLFCRPTGQSFAGKWGVRLTIYDCHDKCICTMSERVIYSTASLRGNRRIDVFCRQ
ncbi:uncharacterized protein PV06_11097 [Exophiala oligosperma]|uniref:Secreted protein n=1 Tax=Exophiala oligosperma TaxID=215243 RepID=A0A0D2DLT0_9EURO|nr:uncharacterized protein PV06_11097 [Exophiala oligosperma]KIW36679.1 hypothetical protein PV06_11097 [Exophiala oligosperma]